MMLQSIPIYLCVQSAMCSVLGSAGSGCKLHTPVSSLDVRIKFGFVFADKVVLYCIPCYVCVSFDFVKRHNIKWGVTVFGTY